MVVRVLACVSPGSVAIVEEADPPVAAGQVLVRTLFSGISAGTELSFYRGSNPYLLKWWDAGVRLFVDGGDARQSNYPALNWGYEEVGIVVETGSNVDSVQPGHIVFGTWGHRSATVLAADYARAHVLPAGVPPIWGIFSHIGAIALNGVLDAGIKLGETVAVFGMGVVGQLVAQMTRLSGAQVIAVDRVRFRLDLAQQLGAAHVVDAGVTRAGEEIKRLTGGQGADVCIECAGSTAALHEAIRACAYSSRVVTLGFFQGEATGLSLGEEFHHNRICVVCSQISGVSPDLQHRWNRERLTQTVMRLILEQRVQVEPLITQVRPVDEAGELFRLLDEGAEKCLQAVMEFGA